MAFLAGDFFFAGAAFLALAVPFEAAVLAVIAMVLAFPATFFGAAFAVFTAFLAVDFAAAAINFLAVAEVRPAAMRVSSYSLLPIDWQYEPPCNQLLCR